MKEFDDILKKKLENLEVPYDLSHWEAMEQELDREEDLRLPLIDALALTHLKDLEATPVPGSWEAFSEKLDAAEITSDPATGIDRIAREQLEELEQPYNPEHWPLMDRRLDEVFTLRGIIYRYKLAEIALMLLLLWTVLLHVEIPSLGEHTDWLQETPSEINSPVPLAPQAEEAPVNPAEVPATDPSIYFAPDGVGEPIAEEGASPSALPPNISGPAGGVASANTGANEAASAVAESPTSQELLPTGVVAPIPRIDIRVEPNTVFPAVAQTEPQPLSPVASVQIYPEATQAGLAIQEVAPIARLKDSHLRVTMLTGPDYNRIYTPADPIFGTPGTYLDSIGYSAGVLVDFQRGPWTLQTGAMYVYKSYRPVLPEQQYGTFDLLVVESFEGISMDMLQIPLNVRYNFLQQNTKWDFYVQGGFGANLLLKPIYDIRQESIQSEEFSKRPNPDEVRSVNSKSKLNEKEFPVGLLEGGALGENSYLTSSIGFGLERYLTDRWSLFLQPQLQYQLPFDGFGPNSDRFHSLSLRLGVRVVVW